jgi:hypothetical protein
MGRYTNSEQRCDPRRAGGPNETKIEFRSAEISAISPLNFRPRKHLVLLPNLLLAVATYI